MMRICAAALLFSFIGVPRGVCAKEMGHCRDVDILGWSKDYSRMGVVSTDVRYGPKPSGWVSVSMIEVGSVELLETQKAKRIAGPMLHKKPVPLLDVREIASSVPAAFRSKHPKKPRSKQPKGAMDILPIWEISELDHGKCTPLIGFVLSWNDEIYYQRHQPMKVELECEHLRYTDHRVYWAKRDLGAAMIRFDYGTNGIQQSVRFPVAAAWHLSRALAIEIRADAHSAKQATEVASAYGRVHVEAGDAGSSWKLSHNEQTLYLAYRIAAIMGGVVSAEPPATGVDLLIERIDGTGEAGKPTAPPWQPKSKTFDPRYDDCGGLLRDCDK